MSTSSQETCVYDPSGACLASGLLVVQTALLDVALPLCRAHGETVAETIALTQIVEPPEWEQLLDPVALNILSGLVALVLRACVPDTTEEADRELTFDEAEAAGLDPTGMDGDPRFPYHVRDLA